MIGFHVSYIYEINGKYLVCIQMDFQLMEAKFKIFATLIEAQNWVDVEAQNWVNRVWSREST